MGSTGHDRRGTSRGRTMRLRLLVAAAAASAGSFGLTGVASAKYVTPEPPETGKPVDVNPDNPNPGGGGVPGSGRDSDRPRAGNDRDRSGELPVTGGDVVGLTALGAGAVAAGALLRRVGRASARI